MILCFQIVLILVKYGKKIYNKIKQKKYSEIVEDVKDAKGEIETVVSQHNANKEKIEEQPKRNE